MEWVAIDPGLSGTGWAYFCDEELKDWGIIYPKGKNFHERANDICEKLIVPPKKSFIEWPSFQKMEAINTFSIVKLAYLIGRIAFPSTILIPVIRWKGNLPKEVTKKRAERFFKCKGFKSHAADAVGIGQYVIETRLL